MKRNMLFKHFITIPHDVEFEVSKKNEKRKIALTRDINYNLQEIADANKRQVH